MTIEAFYSVRFAVAPGPNEVAWGVAMLVFESGRIVGADSAGAWYDGEYQLDSDGILKAQGTVRIPPGVRAVQGVTAGVGGLSISFSFEVPYDQLESPLNVETS